MRENENEIKFHYTQNSGCLATIVYNSMTVLCAGNSYNTCTGSYNSTGKHLHNGLAKKNGKAHGMPVVLVATPLPCNTTNKIMP